MDHQSNVAQDLTLDLADTLWRAMDKGSDLPVTPRRSTVEAESEGDDGAFEVTQVRKGGTDYGLRFNPAQTPKWSVFHLRAVMAVELARSVPRPPAFPFAAPLFAVARHVLVAAGVFCGPTLRAPLQGTQAGILGGIVPTGAT